MEYAYVSWTELDIQSIRPDWNEKKCDEFLENIQDKLINHMVGAGWHFIEEKLKEIGEYPKYRVICRCLRVNISTTNPVTKCKYCGEVITNG